MMLKREKKWMLPASFCQQVKAVGIAAIFAVVALSLSGCGARESDVERGLEEGAEEVTRQFEVRGFVRAIAADGETLTIEHEEIEGFMPAMTMPFYLEDSSLADGLEVDDPVEFGFVVGQSDSSIDRIRILDEGEARSLSTSVRERGNALRAPISRLEEGDLVPNFQLVNQDSEPFEVADFRGSHVVITFIFTRCPVPDFCPLMSKKFRQIQQEINEDPELRDKVHLLSVTIDPEHDTPEILRDYADIHTDSTDNWTFATGDRGRIEEVTTRFSIFVDSASSGESNIDHALGTALIGPDGRLKTIWRGNRWNPEDIIEDIANES